MEKKSEDANLPPSYLNLGLDIEPVSGPSVPSPDYETNAVLHAAEDNPAFEPTAPGIDEEDSSYGGAEELVPGPPVPPPKYEEIADSDSHMKAPTAPAPDLSTDSRTLPCTYPSLVFEDIYEACVKYVKSNCCYSSRFARQMKLTEINNGCAFHYSLESFGEKRESASAVVPYRGGPIDGPLNGRPPSAWEMHVPLPISFEDTKKNIPIPHTEIVETCSRCRGRGKITCSSCIGRGTTSCSSCGGLGHRSRDGQRSRCTSCSGRGRNTCTRCWGRGKVKCPRCDGAGQLKRYNVLIVTWTNHFTDFVSNIGKLPKKKIVNATGDTLLAEERSKLLPIANAPDETVNVASSHLLQAHENSFPYETIRKQRHSLRATHFTVAKYKWKEEEGEFYIYGKEKAVYFECYPTHCCCICC